MIPDDCCLTIHYSNNLKHYDIIFKDSIQVELFITGVMAILQKRAGIECGTPKDYHLMKSLLCRDKGIRLIHIYEFEDFEKQKQLLKDLILGVDNYPKEDFNKNNLIKNVPEPAIIYQKDYTIYGAGPLY